jgi:hypothetical protein
MIYYFCLGGKGDDKAVYRSGGEVFAIGDFPFV